MIRTTILRIPFIAARMLLSNMTSKHPWVVVDSPEGIGVAPEGSPDSDIFKILVS